MDPAARRALDSELDEIAGRSEAMVSAMRDFVGKVDRVTYGELRAIADYICRTREEISALGPVGLSQRRIPQAGAELEAIVRDTGEATHRIMTAAEELLACEAATAEACKAFVAERAVAILEACSFHDLTGQRVSKVVEVLETIEERISRFADKLGVPDEPEMESEAEKLRREQMVAGPALDAAEADQDRIDALFGAAASQDEIDALFR